MTLAVTDHPTDTTLCYTWSNGGQVSKKLGKDVRYFVCTGCRAIADKTGEGIIPAMMGDLKRREWLSTTEDAHFCEPRRKNQVTGTTIRRKAQQALTLGKTHSVSQAARNLESRLTRKLIDLPEEERDDIRNAALGSTKSEPVKRALQRSRKKRFPSDLRTLSDLDPETHLPLLCTLRGSLASKHSKEHQERLVVYNDSDMVIFASRRQLKLMRKTKRLVCDGTFKYSPKKVYQTYRVFGFVKGTHAVPLVTVLLNGKSKRLYKRMWRKIAKLVHTHRIDAAHFDFEPASVSAFRKYFPGVPTKMCVFHLAQAVNRKVQKVGLSKDYRNSEQVENIVRRVVTLCMLPPNEMDFGADLLKQFIKDVPLTRTQKKRLKAVLRYYRSTWIDNSLGRDFVHPMKEGIRTTNHAEGYHNGFRRHFSSVHPSLSEWIVIHRDVHSFEEERAMDVHRGIREPNVRKETYAEVDEKIERKRTEFAEYLQTLPSPECKAEKTWRFLGRMGKLIGITPLSKEARRELRAEFAAQKDAEARLHAAMPSPESEDEAIWTEGPGLFDEVEEEVTATVSVPVFFAEEVTPAPFMPSFTDLIPFLL